MNKYNYQNILTNKCLAPAVSTLVAYAQQRQQQYVQQHVVPVAVFVVAIIAYVVPDVPVFHANAAHIVYVFLADAALYAIATLALVALK